MATLTLTLNPQAVPETQPAAAAATPSPATGFLLKTLDLNGEQYLYCVYVPPEYTPDRPWPVILFLHGSGERGLDGLRQTDVGIGRAIRQHRHMIPAVVIMPQCRPGQYWIGPMVEMALKCVEAASREYRFDPRRVYLTGISMGGHGVWHIGAAMPQNFAALVPICGFAELREAPQIERALAQRLTQIPIRCYHGGRDQNVPPARSRAMVAAIRDLGGLCEYTEYPDGDHLIWDRAYDDPMLWRWLLAQERPVSPTSATTAPATASAP